MAVWAFVHRHQRIPHVVPFNKDPGRVTEVIEEIRRATPGAREELFALVYGELRRLAASFMREQRGDHTLQPTALVHEAYLRLMGGMDPQWNDRMHFMNAAARAMRTILVDMARARAAQKRGGGRVRITLDEALQGGRDPNEDVIAIHDALQNLEEVDPQWARVVELRFFAGLGLAETARVMEVSEPTVHRAWHHARAWLYRRMTR